METRPRIAVRRLAAARVISLAGGAAAFTALNFTIYERTRSPAWVAAALFLTFGTMGFVSPVAGAIGDRFDRQKVMIASDVAGAVCFGAMGFAHDPGLLIGLAFLAALAEAPFWSASAAAIPNLAGEGELGWANGMVNVGRQAGILVGPAVGGALLAAFGSGPVFWMNGATFAVSAVLVGTIRGRFSVDPDGRDQPDAHRGLRAGFRFLFGEPALRTLTLAWLVLVLGLGMSMVADVPLAELFGTGAWGYGVIISAWGGGSVLGSLTGRWIHAANEARVLVLGTAGVAVTAIAVGLSRWFAGVIGAVLVMGFADGANMVAQQGILQRRTPDAVRSRTSAAFDAFIHVGLALSYLVAGPAVEGLGARGVYLVGGLISLIGVAILLPMVRWERGRAIELAEAAVAAEAGPEVELLPEGDLSGMVRP